MTIIIEYNPKNQNQMCIIGPHYIIPIKIYVIAYICVSVDIVS